MHDESDDDGADAQGELADAHVDSPPEEVHKEYLNGAEWSQKIEKLTIFKICFACQPQTERGGARLI